MNLVLYAMILWVWGSHFTCFLTNWLLPVKIQTILCYVSFVIVTCFGFFYIDKNLKDKSCSEILVRKYMALSACGCSSKFWVGLIVVILKTFNKGGERG